MVTTKSTPGVARYVMEDQVGFSGHNIMSNFSDKDPRLGGNSQMPDLLPEGVFARASHRRAVKAGIIADRGPIS